MRKPSARAHARAQLDAMGEAFARLRELETRNDEQGFFTTPEEKREETNAALDFYRVARIAAIAMARADTVRANIRAARRPIATEDEAMTRNTAVPPGGVKYDRALDEKPPDPPKPHPAHVVGEQW